MGLTIGALAAASALPGGLLRATDAMAATSTPPTSLTPDQALARLTAGNRRFVRGTLRHPRRDGPRRAAVAEGQAPYAVVLGCADSRVPPEVIHDQGLGDLFVVRIAGNTATDSYVAIDVAQNGTQLPGDIGAFVAPIVPIAAGLIPTTPTGSSSRPSRSRTFARASRRCSRTACSPTRSWPASSRSWGVSTAPRPARS